MKKKECSGVQAKVFIAALFMGAIQVLQCGGGNCFSCFGCVGAGGLAVCAGLWNKFYHRDNGPAVPAAGRPRSIRKVSLAETPLNPGNRSSEHKIGKQDGAGGYPHKQAVPDKGNAAQLFLDLRHDFFNGDMGFKTIDDAGPGTRHAPGK